MGNKSRSEELQEHHNKGQLDGANGDYDPPPANNLLNLFDPTSLNEERTENREIYEIGRENGLTGGD